MKTVTTLLGLSFVLLAVTSPTLAQSDIEPPVLTTFDFNPKSVDVTGAPASISGQFSVHDTLSGVTYARVSFRSPSGSQYLECGSSSPSSGTTHDGTWTCNAVVAQYVEAGTWTVDHLLVIDVVGNYRYYYAPDLGAAGLPTQLQVTSFQDVAPPTLTTFDFNPKSVDVTGAPASISGQFSVHDTLSGVTYARVSFRSPSGSQYLECGSSSPSSGTTHDGTWTCNAVVAQYVEAGTWTVDHLLVIDVVGNYRYYYAPDLGAAGLPTQLQVTSFQDVAPPTLTTFDFNPKSVDVTGAPASISGQFSVHDTLSGVTYARVSFRSPSGSQYLECGSSSPSSGTTHDGTWTCNAVVAQYVEAGTWTVDHLLVIDVVGNYRYYYAPDLGHLGFPTELHVCSDHLGRDADADGWGDDCDNCSTIYNPSQLDTDEDQAGQVCDNCLTDYNPTQSDFDADSVGDRCDLNDGLIYIFITDRDYIDWQNEAGPNAWNVYEGDLTVLRNTGVYTQQPSSNPLADRRCHLGLNYTDDFTAPPPGTVQFSLVTGMTGLVEGSLGTSSAGVPRANTSPCP